MRGNLLRIDVLCQQPFYFQVKEPVNTFNLLEETMKGRCQKVALQSPRDIVLSPGFFSVPESARVLESRGRMIRLAPMWPF